MNKVTGGVTNEAALREQYTLLGEDYRKAVPDAAEAVKDVLPMP
jgi:hypothetical protein